MSFPFSMMAKLAWLTLMRLSEIQCLRREHVHLDQGVVRLPRAKGGARAVMLSETARKLRPSIRRRVAARQLLGRASWVMNSRFSVVVSRPRAPQGVAGFVSVTPRPPGDPVRRSAAPHSRS